MKVIFVAEKDPTWVAAYKIESQSADGCFSPNEIALLLGVSRAQAQANVDRLEERGLCARMDERLTEPRKGDERWCLIKPSLTVGREYEVLAIEGDNYLLLNEPETEPYGNDPVLFHQSLFQISDATEPTFWSCETNSDGERYCCPPGWNRDGFFEDYHDGIEVVRRRFWKDLKKYYRDMARAYPNTLSALTGEPGEIRQLGEWGVCRAEVNGFNQKTFRFRLMSVADWLKMVNFSTRLYGFP